MSRAQGEAVMAAEGSEGKGSGREGDGEEGDYPMILASVSTGGEGERGGDGRG